METRNAARLIKDLRTRGLTIATAESCTGGLLAGAITAIAGSSDVFPGGIVSYSNRIKELFLKVPAKTLARCGAVSEEVAIAMARGVVRGFGSDIGVGITGVAGPGGGSDAKPVGMVCFGFVINKEESTVTRSFRGTRGKIRAASVQFAIDYIIDALDN